MFKSTFLLAGGVSLLAATTVLADTHSADIDRTLVTASRAPLALSRVTSATTVFDALQIEQRKTRYVSDLLRTVPGFAVSRSGVEGAQTQVRVRGTEANHVLVLIDGVRVNDPGSDDGFRWEQLTTANIERIEIIRGAQSALWGTDAIGAVVNIVSREAGTGARGTAYLEGGTYRTANGGVSLGYGGTRWKVSAAAERLKTDGESIAVGGSEDDDSDTSTAAFGASLTASDDLSFDLRLRAVEAYSQNDLTDFATGLPGDSNSVTDAKTLSARAQARLETFADTVTHTFSLGWFDSENLFLVDDIFDRKNLSDRLTFAWQSDIRLNGDLLSLAVERETTDFEYRGQAFSPLFDPNQTQSIDVTSVIADYQGLSTEGLTWLASVRYDDNSDFDDAVNGRVGVAYQAAAATKIRASVGTGRKNPSFTERFGFFPNSFVGNPDLQPEKSVSYEVGVDQRLLDDKLTLELTLYHQDLEDEINGFAPSAVPGLSTAVNLDGRSKRRGAELAASLNLNSNVEFGAQYSYVKSRQKDASGVEQTEIRRPRHTGSLQTIVRNDSNSINAVLNADYNGSRTDTFFAPFPAPPATVKLANYWLVDLTVNAALNDVFTVFVRGANLLDEDYEEVFGYNTLGRTWYLGVRAAFGD